MKWDGVVNGVRLERVCLLLADGIDIPCHVDITQNERDIAEHVLPLIEAMRAKGYSVRDCARFAKREAAMMAAELDGAT